MIHFEVDDNRNCCSARLDVIESPRSENTLRAEAVTWPKGDQEVRVSISALDHAGSIEIRADLAGLVVFLQDLLESVELAGRGRPVMPADEDEQLPPDHTQN